VNVLVITPPDPLISIDEARVHLKDPDPAEDELIETYIAAASAWIDGPAGWLGRSLGQQTLELQTDDFDFCERLPYGPVQSVESVKYIDGAGVEQTVAPSSFRMNGDHLTLAHGGSWPSNRDSGGVRVRYVTGGDIPQQARQAVLLLVGQWFRNRMAVVVGTISSELPFGVDALLAPLRRLN